MEHINLFKKILERMLELEKEIGVLSIQYKEQKHIYNTQYLTKLNTPKSYVNYHNVRTLYKNALKEYKELELYLNSISTFDIDDAKYNILYYFDLLFKEEYIIDNYNSKKNGIRLNGLLIHEKNDLEKLEKTYLLLPKKGKINIYYLYKSETNPIVKEILYRMMNDLIINDNLDKENNIFVKIK